MEKIMRCPRCDAELTNNVKVCRFCGQDLEIIQHINRISNAYYNMGLEKAQVRDLSGAAIVLRKSLEYNKTNTKARNLLGLVYYELGEIVAALAEWIISCHFEPNNNRARYYIDEAQDNKTAFNNYKLAIKKYNSALKAMKEGNTDLAIIQLKKVVSLNPKFVRGAQLLALAHMINHDFVRAVKVLKKIHKVDFNNTTTLRYMQEIGARFSDNNKIQESTIKSFQQRARQEARESGQIIENDVDQNKRLTPVFYIVGGIIAGLIVAFVLIRPTLSGNKLTQNSESLYESNQQLSVMEAKASSYEKEVSELNKKVEKLQAEIDKGELKNYEIVKRDEALLQAMKYYEDGELLLAAGAVSQYKASDYSAGAERELYQKVSKKLTSDDVSTLVSEGRSKFNSSNYDGAKICLQQALLIDKNNLDALYFMGRVYQMKNNYKKAKEYYDKVIKVGPNTSQFNNSKERLGEMGYQ
ncbi:tetratricopeptide repeat protein [Eubacterium xylanophilum]|uniref:tetratricopeptide repeat protein n=1 Tax=Eubacterium xylanophilum TaxID=39497 RepID=UPI0012EC1937|nr:tetratricopeptide repeat protein [Eubacterium xylanophilum]